MNGRRRTVQNDAIMLLPVLVGRWQLECCGKAEGGVRRIRVPAPNLDADYRLTDVRTSPRPFSRNEIGLLVDLELDGRLRYDATSRAGSASSCGAKRIRECRGRGRPGGGDDGEHRRMRHWKTRGLLSVSASPEFTTGSCRRHRDPLERPIRLQSKLSRIRIPANASPGQSFGVAVLPAHTYFEWNPVPGPSSRSRKFRKLRLRIRATSGPETRSATSPSSPPGDW